MASVFPPLATPVIDILENLKKISNFTETSLREEQENFDDIKKLTLEIDNCFDTVLKSVQSNNKLISTPNIPAKY